MSVLVIITLVLAIVAIVLAIIALGAVFSAFQRIAYLARPGRATHDPILVQRLQHLEAAYPKPHKRVAPWVIYNPVKVGDVAQFRTLIETRAATTGYLPPHFVETTVESPGTLQAIEAVRANADLVIAAGGDGTQRAVAAGMAHSGIPIGIIPCGTGNLLARNLDIPVAPLEDAVEIAMTGANFAVDLGWFAIAEDALEVDSPSEGSQLRAGMNAPGPRSPAFERMLQHMPEAAENEYAFLVMSGVGFDADMMASTNPKLKKSIGWLAYVVSGIKKHRTPRLRASLRLGDEQSGEDVRARTILFANCGQLPGDVALLPDAAPGDGWIDVAVLDTRVGVLGWMELGWRVLAQGLGVRRGLPSLSSTLNIRKTRRIDVRLQKPRNAQVDGDVIAKSAHVSARLDRHCLVYRIP